ncbi:hypothetical protein [Elstera cyanobacteriorum]|nr:hypothetical protein [Elstera cyanobacteriorum]MCK6444139.1 hypothetical protein [Elstera cyanobacteriorum]
MTRTNIVPLWFPKRLLADGWWLTHPNPKSAIILPFPRVGVRRWRP